jgi:hypothetical protein
MAEFTVTRQMLLADPEASELLCQLSERAGGIFADAPWETVRVQQKNGVKHRNTVDEATQSLRALPSSNLRTSKKAFLPPRSSETPGRRFTHHALLGLLAFTSLFWKLVNSNRIPE